MDDTMGFAGNIAGIFKKDWKLFVVSNVFLFGLFAVGVLAGMAFPDVHDQLIRWIEQATTTGPVGTASDTLKAGDIWLGTWQIFSHNYFVTIVVGILSLIFPPPIFFVFGIQFFAFSIVYSIPAMLQNPVTVIPVLREASHRCRNGAGRGCAVRGGLHRAHPGPGEIAIH
jgi:hypothetical protein